MPNDKVITRFAPSPTGALHIGSVRTALFNYLFAKQNGGKFLLRIEDTDAERSKPEFEADIKEGLEWLGIKWDNDDAPRQSERKEIYKKYLQKMIDEGKAYVSKEEPKEEGQRTEVIRLKNPGAKIEFFDIIRGGIEFDTTELGNFVIAKDMETPLYHLAVVVDDFEMGVTHIIRGEDGISNTPRQILIQQAISAPRPFYAHLPLILAPDRSKLSKRHGAVSVGEYKKMGYLPEAIINFFAFIGWNPGTEKEIYNMEELARDFSLEKIQKGGATFNMEKLDWVNGEYIKNMATDKLVELCEPFLKIKNQNAKVKKIIELKKERMQKLSEVGDDVDYFFELPEYAKEKLAWKLAPLGGETKQHLKKVSELLHDIAAGDWTREKIKTAVWPYAEAEGRGNVLWPFRMALTGQDKSPDPFVVADILGKEETLKRLQIAINKI